MNGFRRPWHLGVLWNRDSRLAGPLLDRFRVDPELCVGDNEPYSGREVGFSARGRSRKRDNKGKQGGRVAHQNRLAMIMVSVATKPTAQISDRQGDQPRA